MDAVLYIFQCAGILFILLFFIKSMTSFLFKSRNRRWFSTAAGALFGISVLTVLVIQRDSGLNILNPAALIILICAYIYGPAGGVTAAAAASLIFLAHYDSPYFFAVITATSFISGCLLFYYFKPPHKTARLLIFPFMGILASAFTILAALIFDSPDIPFRYLLAAPALIAGAVEASLFGFFFHSSGNERTDIDTSLDLIKTLAEDLPYRIFFKDLKLRYISCNSAYAEDRNIAPEEIYGKTDFDFFPEDLARKIRETDKKILKSDTQMILEEPYIEQGRDAWISVILSPVKDPQGKVLGILGIAWDITEEKQKEEKIRALNESLEEKQLEKERELGKAMRAYRSQERILKLSEAKFRSAFSTATHGMFICNIHGRFLEVNDAFCEMTGYDQEELLHKKISELTREDYRGDDEKTLAGLAEGELSSIQEERVCLAKNGDSIWAIIGLSRIGGENNGPVQIVGQMIDMSMTKRMISTLESSVKIIRLMNEASQDEIINLALEEGVKITESEIGYFHFIDDDEKTITLQTWSNKTRKNCKTVSEGHYPIDKAGLWVDSFREKKPVIHNDYLSDPRKKDLPKGHIPIKRHLSVPIFYKGKIVAIIGVGNKAGEYDEFDINRLSLLTEVMWSILERKKNEEKLKDLAHIDQLTNIPNRNLFYERITHFIKLADRTKHPFALFYLDLDGFKEINDKHGHRAGDFVLQKTAERLKKKIRTSDTVARIGGDEFIILFPQMSHPDDAEAMGGKIINAVSEPISWQKEKLIITPSIGAAFYPENGETVKELIEKADQAMYTAKQSGKNKLVIL